MTFHFHIYFGKTTHGSDDLAAHCMVSSLGAAIQVVPTAGPRRLPRVRLVAVGRVVTSVTPPAPTREAPGRALGTRYLCNHQQVLADTAPPRHACYQGRQRLYVLPSPVSCLHLLVARLDYCEAAKVSLVMRCCGWGGRGGGGFSPISGALDPAWIKAMLP